MSKTDLLFCLLKQPTGKLTGPEKLLLEIKLIACISEALAELYRSQHKAYYRLLKSHQLGEEAMFSVKVIYEIIHDILSTEEYTLSGIAAETQIPEEVLSDVAAGLNVDPTFEASKKIIALHISIRKNLYDSIMRKVAQEYLSSA